MSAKTVRIPIPFEMYRIEEMQSYFEDMSAKGYHIHKLGRRKNDFILGESETLRYRIEIAKKYFGGLGSDQLEFYKEASWKSVDWLENYHLFVSKEPASPELHSDPFELSMVVNGLENRLKWAIAMNLVVMIIYVLSAALWIKRDYYYDSRYLTYFFTFMMSLILIYGIARNYRMVRYLHDLKGRLAHGEVMRTGVTYTPLIRRYKYERILDMGWRILIILMQFSLLYTD